MFRGAPGFLLSVCGKRRLLLSLRSVSWKPCKLSRAASSAQVWYVRLFPPFGLTRRSTRTCLPASRLARPLGLLKKFVLSNFMFISSVFTFASISWFASRPCAALRGCLAAFHVVHFLPRLGAHFPASGLTHRSTRLPTAAG